ncbi:glutamine synthetase family protein [Mycobacterium conspicuum]|uniref:glutamine synthetase family protein n=1 Tax=Mycobacterium conspicuum TaxID=44010 RepID=UPI000A167CA5|nr:glutamine synthetase family protein [Mycobacterium conspicuum]ORV38370.1 glutamine synthetase [Mycobacterium conspicuum]
MTATPLATAAIGQLEAEGVDTVIGTAVNPAGLTQAKTVPIRRTNTFANPGLGASPSWHAFVIDQTGIADVVPVIGDQRLRIDLSALRIIGDGLAWAPASFFEQDGTPVPECSRGTLGRIEAALAQAGIEALIGHEIEFLLVDPDGGRLRSALWTQYGLVGVLEHEAFIRDVHAAAVTAGVGIEQFHPEYAANQFEISLSPLAPVAAADQLALTRLIISRVARRHGLRVSLSPAPFAGNVGSGAHQHFSLSSADGPLFSGGTGAVGMTAAGEHAVAGIVRGLPEAQAVLCGSIVSGLRMQPSNWAGVYACWGTENREAAVRIVRGGPGTAYGGNVEVRIVDPSANPYFASAAILGLALEGIRDKAALPPEATQDPASLPEAERDAAGIVRLPDSQPESIAALDGSKRLRSILGDAAVDMVIAVRGEEHKRYSDLEPEQLADKFRMAWSL